MPEATTNAPASIDAQLAELEQAVSAEAAKAETVEEPEKEQSEAPQEPEAPQYGQAFEELAQKKGFKSPDDLVRAYKALESRTTKESQKSRQLEEQLEGIQKLKVDPDATDEQQQALSILENTIKNILSRELAPIKEQFGVQKVDRIIEEMRGNYPEFTGPIVDETLDYMIDHPKVSIEDAYKIVSWDQVRNQSKVTEKRQVKEQEKSRAFVESASGAKSGTELDYSKLTLQELEDILPKSGSFVDSRGKVRQ